ncbi:transposase, family IS1341 [Scytonema sp. HK-05]|uniref:hypothetical protein n=1 Tax=Scytonema sp. HK-05 TaxID=1137095 RepID=UPI000936A4C8|nr:hypothetical protein [Scytonema sp. HK-05]OKH57494.1 hypothetical protein NIES2130_19695 [Scytonema sp. HK-05]BAY45860.1 transposase, family IS1341 [Scytonema sp. HK-05]
MKKLPYDVKQVLSAKEKLIATSKKENWLQEVQRANQICLNDTLPVAFENSKLFWDIRLQKSLELIKSEKEVSHNASRNRHAKKTPHPKRTPSVQLRLMALSPRGKQFTADINDHITKQSVTFNNLNKLELTLYLRIFPYYISQEIYNNRVQRTGNRGQRCHLFPVLYHLKRRKANVSQSKWSYAELDGFIYSVVMNNSSAIRVDADALGEEKNSKAEVLLVKPPRLHVVKRSCCFSKPEPRDYCTHLHPCCGHTNKHKCPNQGLTIGCSRSRGFELCADLVGGRNVAMRTLLLRQDGRNTGLLVTAYPPKVSLFQGNNTIVSPFRADKSGVRRILKPELKSLKAF